MQKPPPCYQDWDAMAEVPGGRLCPQCDNTIVDFSKKTWEDILEIQKASQFTTCGKYSKKQIRHWGHQPPTIDLAWFRKFSLTGMLVLLGLKSADAQEIEPTATEVVVQDSVFTPSDSVAYVEFKGRVIDSVSQEPLVGAVIWTIGKDVTTITNENGDFILKFEQETSRLDSVRVVVDFVGYVGEDPFIYRSNNNVIPLTQSKIKSIPMPTYFRVEEPKVKLRPIGNVKSWFSED